MAINEPRFDSNTYYTYKSGQTTYSPNTFVGGGTTPNTTGTWTTSSTGFNLPTLEDPRVEALMERIDALERQLSYVLERLEMFVDLADG